MKQEIIDALCVLTELHVTLPRKEANALYVLMMAAQAGAQDNHDDFISSMLTKWKTGLLCGQDAMVLLFRHYSSNPALVPPVQAQEPRKPLTDEQIYDVVLAIKTRPPTSLQIVRAIEAAHGIKEQQ